MCLQVLNFGPSRSVDTVVDIALPKILAPHKHRLLQVVDWQVGQPAAAALATFHYSVCMVHNRKSLKPDLANKGLKHGSRQNMAALM